MPIGLAVDKVDDVVTGVSGAPVTFDRKPPRGLEKKLSNPGMPRANIAPSAERPDSDVTPLPSCEQKSVLQQHIQFFDRNRDGIIFPHETFAGFRALGWGLYFSFIFTCFINGTMSYATLDSWIPDLRFPIYVKNAHKCKHGSDSEVYDTEGRFVPEKFEELFSKFDKDNKKALTFWELWDLTEAIRNANDPYGWFAAKSEWIVFYFTAGWRDKMISKEKVRAQYDGSLWYQIENDMKVEKEKSKEKLKKK
ncbi:caleosin [Chytridium lagenaria]|nr:caleosin [Chytridium lagenaria]